MTNLWAFLHQTVAVSIVALFLLLLQRLFQDKLSPRWQYGVWLVLLARTLIPVGLPGRVVSGSGTLWLEMARIEVERKLSSAFASPWSSGLPRASIPWWDGSMPASVTDLFFLLYLAGAAAAFLWFLGCWLRLGLRLKQSAPAAGPERIAQVERVALAYGLLLPHRMVECSGVDTPFLYGVVRPTLVLPAGQPVDDKVILHELLHLKYYDVAQSWLTTLLRCVHWPNPLLWRVCDRIGNDREALCDQRVLELLEGEERRDYGRLLLAMADDRHTRTPGTTSMANGGRHIRARIQAIARFKRFPQGMGLVSVCMIVVLTSALILGAPAAAVEGQTVPTDIGSESEAVEALAWAINTNASTVAGALDCYAKSVIYNNGVYRMVVTPEEDRDALMERMGGVRANDRSDMNLDESVWLDGGLPEEHELAYLLYNPVSTGTGIRVQMLFPALRGNTQTAVWDTVEVTGNDGTGYFVTCVDRNRVAWTLEQLDEAYQLLPVFLTYTAETPEAALTVLLQQQVTVQDPLWSDQPYDASFGYGPWSEEPDLNAHFTGYYSFAQLTASNQSSHVISTLSLKAEEWVGYDRKQSVGRLETLFPGESRRDELHGCGGGGSSDEPLEALLCPTLIPAVLTVNDVCTPVTLTLQEVL